MGWLERALQTVHAAVPIVVGTVVLALVVTAAVAAGLDTSVLGAASSIVLVATWSAVGQSYLVTIRAVVVREPRTSWAALALAVAAALMLLGHLVEPVARRPDLAAPFDPGTELAWWVALPVGILLGVQGVRFGALRAVGFVAGAAALAWWAVQTPVGVEASAPAVAWALVALWALATFGWMSATGPHPRWTEIWVGVGLSLLTASFLLLAVGSTVADAAGLILRWGGLAIPAAGMMHGLARVHRTLELRTRELEEEAGRRAETNSELARRNVELDAYAAVLAHDLRAPLTMASWSLETLATAYEQEWDDDARHLLARAQLGQRRAATLISDLLTLARSSERDLRLQAIEVADLVDELVPTMPELDPDHVRVVSDAPVVADEAALRQILQNLLGNAVAYRREGTPPRIDIVVRYRSGQGWEIEVADAGVGIPPEQRHRVFTPFERLEATSGRASGSGLGLAIVRRLVERHRGSIEVRDSQLGGCAFVISLPPRLPSVVDLRDVPTAARSA